jgi:2C-methyl-D-erythritol 2,4-cyclodiphosphate synthase
MSTSGAAFQQFLDQALRYLQPSIYRVYIVDIIVYLSSFSEYIQALKLMLNRLCEDGLKLNLEKCNFAQTEIKILGHLVDN